MQKILVTGGAGFVGSNLALRLKERRSQARVVALDNLKRRGSELILPRLRAGGVDFVHGDTRVRGDVLAAGPVDLIVDCAAEPSALAGLGGAPDYVVGTNLTGTVHCLELARREGAAVVFLSTSRVYPYATINGLGYRETETRFELEEAQAVAGASGRGIAETFPLDGPRSIYGATKLASELLLQEYGDAYGVRAIIDRCGVVTGPWQMGKVDQGVVVLWVAKHVFGGRLSYIGWGGAGKQVRDVLHVGDLHDLVERQIARIDEVGGEVFNVGGGAGTTVSLAELTELCRASTGNTIEIDAVEENRRQDVISYVTDGRKVQDRMGWQPTTTAGDLVDEVTRWVVDHRAELEPVLG